MLDEVLVGADHEGRPRDEEEEPDRLERLDDGVRQAPVEVVDEDDEGVDLAVLEQTGEVVAELADRLPGVGVLLGRLLDELLDLVDV